MNENHHKKCGLQKTAFFVFLPEKIYLKKHWNLYKNQAF